jgi:hypothetical protein
VLALDLESPVPDFLTLEGTMAELRRQDAVVLIPHPTFATVSLEREYVGTYRDRIDALETYNPKHLPWHNRRAPRIADEFDLPAFASSYAHLPSTVGEAWTAFADPIPDEDAFHASFREGWPRSVGHHRGVGHLRQRLLEMGHLGWENSWQKFERLFLSGTEPTHPAHVAYGGEFDDVRVY